MKKYTDKTENLMFKKNKNLEAVLKMSYMQTLAYEKALKEQSLNKKAG